MGRRRSRGAIRGVVLTTLVAAPLAAFLYWFLACPCDRIPGGYLLGAVAERPVTDWSFANDVALCQIQINAGLLPHSINLNCMATTAGDLYLSCAQCDGKRWSNAVLDSSAARLRLNETVFPVTVIRVSDPSELDRAWGARVAKLARGSALDTPPPPDSTPRPDDWWSFRVTSR